MRLHACMHARPPSLPCSRTLTLLPPDVQGKRPNNMQGRMMNYEHMGTAGAASPSQKHGSSLRSKAAKAEALRKEIEALSSSEVVQRLRGVFDSYCDMRRFLATQK
jgi:hypothetical protein